ncbi:hypothetical protein [Streptomyces sporangiiformans]|uniref:Uncharacterized protein n=1 Tax=Streptomyces sporangiiformans TaxID=2315329 RepID=A0A505DEW0_9ACTN|nr:hypothetical protein [Streptomyces sporangiiformans]TPQ21250.1 hypothetical protein FGD71_016565 [Streptomyces sporangiiformans]
MRPRADGRVRQDRNDALRAFRADRILDEARETEDPVHLVRIFGISITTAMKYIHTAHPHRGGPIPP